VHFGEGIGYITAFFHDKAHYIKALETIYWDFAQFFADPLVGALTFRLV
jgi:hypothetical protein